MAEKPFQRLRRFLRELKRRNVYKVAATYVVVAFVGLQAVDLLIPATTLPGWADELFLALVILGFPVSLVVAWAFEMSAEGMRRTPEAEVGEELRPTYQWIGLAVVLALAGGVWYVTAGDRVKPPPNRTAATDTARSESAPAERSIAVLPFDNLSGTEDAQPFVNGIHEDLLTRLSNVSELTVISRTSVLPYGETELSLPAIADSLGVRWIVEGGVQQAGDQVQVNAQLIEAEKDAHRWAENYRRKLTTDNIFAIQSELTQKIIKSLKAQLTSAEKTRVEREPTENLEAYRAYVEARTRLQERTEGGIRQAIELFRHAVSRDSGYAPAWSGLADARRLLGYYGHAPSDSMYSAALVAAKRALELNSDLAEAHASLGSLYTVHLHNIPRAIRELRRAVELRPSYPTAQMWLGERYAFMGWRHEALQHTREAVELDPHSPIARLVLGWTLWWVDGPTGEAFQQIRRATELEPGLAMAQADEGIILSDAGRHEEAIDVFHRALKVAQEGTLAWAWALSGLGTAYTRTGDTTRARNALHRLQAEGSDSFAEAKLQSALGDVTGSIESLREVDWESWKLWDLRFMPSFAAVREDSRYRDLIGELNRGFGLNPDGSLPDSVDVSLGAETDD